MKSTTSTVIILALIMLLLVMVAAFVFLFQGRQTLEGQRDELATAVTGLDMTRTQLDLAFQSVEATRLGTGQELATAVAEAVLYEGQLVESQQQVDMLVSQVDGLTGELAAASGTVAANVANTPPESVPTVQIVSPSAGTAVTVGQPLDIVFAAADPAGLATLNLTINGESLRSYDPGDATLYTARETWTPAEPGEVEIGVLAVNVNGRVSNPTTLTLTVTATTQSAALSQLSSSGGPALRAEIESLVSQIRGLPPQTPVVTTLLTGDELRQRVENDLLAEYSEADAQQDVLVYAAFDFLAPDFDLYTFSRDLYSEQITGFYDPATDEFVVVSEDDVLDANEQLTHAHEYMHALQDQHFSLDLLDDDTLDADAKATLLALAEGEAMLLQTHFIQQGYVDLLDVSDILAALETPVLASAPPILANSLLYPYRAGQTFAQTLYDQEGYAALNAAWANRPQSTEQILHPDRYLAGDAPQVVILPPLTATLGTGWTLVHEDVFGEFMLREYLSQQLNSMQVDTAAMGWGGDRFAVYTNEANGALALALRLVWDTDQDATEFAALYPNYPAALFSTPSQLQGNGGECWPGPDDLICLFQTGRETLIIRAPDQGTAVRLLNEIRD